MNVTIFIFIALRSLRSVLYQCLVQVFLRTTDHLLNNKCRLIVFTKITATHIDDSETFLFCTRHPIGLHFLSQLVILHQNHTSFQEKRSDTKIIFFSGKRKKNRIKSQKTVILRRLRICENGYVVQFFFLYKMV